MARASAVSNSASGVDLSLRYCWRSAVIGESTYIAEFYRARSFSRSGGGIPDVRGGVGDLCAEVAMLIGVGRLEVDSEEEEDAVVADELLPS